MIWMQIGKNLDYHFYFLIFTPFMIIGIFLLLADKYHCSPKRTVKALKRKANETDGSHSYQCDVQETKQRFQNGQSTIATKQMQNPGDSALGLNLNAMLRQQNIKGRFSNQQRSHALIDKKHESITQKIDDLSNPKAAICSTGKYNVTTRDTKSDKPVQSLTHNKCQQLQLPSQAATAVSNHLVDDDNVNLPDQMEVQIFETYTPNHAADRSFSFLSFAHFLNRHIGGTVDTSAVYRQETDMKHKSTMHSKPTHTYGRSYPMYARMEMIGVDSYNNYRYGSFFGKIDIFTKNDSSSGILTYIRNLDDKAEFEHAFKEYVVHQDPNPIALKLLAEIYINFIAYKCFEYNEGLRCYILKNELRGLHEYMTEFYFYIMWKLEILGKDIKKIVREVEKEIEENIGIGMEIVKKLAKEGKSNKEELKNALEKYKEEKYKPYKDHLIKEIRYINDIIGYYTAFESTEKGVDQNKHAGFHTREGLLTIINDFRCATKNYLLIYHKGKKITLVYNLVTKIRNFRIGKVDKKKAQNKNNTNCQPQTNACSELKSTNDDTNQGLNEDQEFYDDKNKFKNSMFLMLFLLDYRTFDFKDLTLENSFDQKMTTSELVAKKLLCSKNLTILKAGLILTCKFLQYIENHQNQQLITAEVTRLKYANAIANIEDISKQSDAYNILMVRPIVSDYQTQIINIMRSNSAINH